MRHQETTQASINSVTIATTQFTSLDYFDHDAAHCDGWALSDCGSYADGSPRVELQKLDNPPTGTPMFSEDRAAWAHVVARARAGSFLHLEALELVDRRERLAIEATAGVW
ncbi:hypothetical protein WOB59_00395 [Methylocystis sp. IM4]|uniref:hypothetical protein n=1 Tax=Methylocystis sp. IM4 TaxID=3136560 RepID=UPI00311A8A80